MSVPTAVKNLDIPDTTFDEASGVKTAGRKSPRRFDIVPVKIQRLLSFFAEVHGFWDRCLHSERHFVLPDPRQYLRVRKFLVLLLIQEVERIQLSATILPTDALRIAQVKHRVTLASHQHSLMFGRHEARSPQAIEKALFGEMRPRVHDHVVGQVFVHGTEAVA